MSLNIANIAIQGVDAYRRSLGVDALNLSAAGASAGKRTQNFVMANEGAVSTVDTTKIRHLNEQGPSLPSSIATYFSIEGNGWAFVKNQLGSEAKLGFARDCTFRPDANQNFVNNNNDYLQVLLTNPDGSLIPASANASKLTTLNVKGLFMTGSPTSVINLASRLPAATESGSIFTQNFSVFDLTGVQHPLSVTWTRGTAGATLTNPNATQSWIFTVDGGANGPTIDTTFGRSGNGVVVQFDQNGFPLDFTGASARGAFSTTSLSSIPMNVTWPSTSGNLVSSSISISIPIGASAGSNTVMSEGTVYGKVNNTANGNMPGDYEDINFDSQGFGNVLYSNGLSAPYCRIPLGVFNNVDGLEETRTGFFQETLLSGPHTVELPGVGNNDAIKVGHYEGSTVDPTKAYVKMIEDQQFLTFNFKSIEAYKQITDSLLRL